MQNILKYRRYLNKKVSDNNQIYFGHQNYSVDNKGKYISFIKATKKFSPNLLIKEGGKRTKNFFRRNLKRKPLISIITVVYNGQKEIENTIKSVLLQNYDNTEYIIVDGGSSDGTISIIKKYDKYLDYWISQKDKGTFDAWNKGIILSTGDYICFLNAGDYFTENALNLIVKKINQKKIDIIFSPVLKKKKFYGFYPKKIYSRLNIIPSFTSTFVNKNIYKKYGLFNLNLKHFSDYEFIYRIINEKNLIWDTTDKNKIITVFDLKGGTSKLKILDLLKSELKIRLKYESYIFVLIKIFLKYIRFYYIKIFEKKKFDKYN